mmetsp:Transcript_6233/g.16672  ORF Transcript_6233/g.16672 Transcript_6233/m.16672 type:complete len:944 (-) Transcript_6233:116-2947(-)
MSWNAARVLFFCQVIQHALAGRSGRSHTISWGTGGGDFAVSAAFLNNYSKEVALDPSCGKTVLVTSKDSKWDRCPDSCPLYVSNKIDDKACSFLCVPAEDCAKYNPKTPIADMELRVCRAPMVNSCAEYAADGSDRCAKCQSWYYLYKKDGKCYSEYVITLALICSVLLIVVILLVAWLCDMGFREISNPAGVLTGELFRERQKLCMPKEEGRSRQLWPLATNLCRTQVAGPGMVLHFNFQAGVIAWAVAVALAWVLMAAIIDGDLFILGTRAFGTPRSNCILVAWGYETQQRLMWTKVGFLYLVYIVSFAICLLHGVRQLRIFQIIDYENKTMKDFAAMATGLPPLDGTAFVEETMKKAVADATGQKVVGVSVAWDYGDESELVQSALERELRRQEETMGQGLEAASSNTTTAEQLMVEMPQLRRKCFEIEQKVFGEAEEPTEEACEDELMNSLRKMKCSSNAFVVFETEAMRDAAVKECQQSGGFAFEGASITLESLSCEPDTVMWQNFGHAGTMKQILRLCAGFGFILLALLFWTLVFYAPYAWSIFSFNYENGAQPGAIYGIVFSMVVVIGNAIMYEVCARVADGVRFLFKDARETCYMILYTIACSFNVILDMVTMYFLVWEIIKGLHFRTYDGTMIHHVDGFNDRFEAYAMQRSLGENSYSYAWPSTFLIPFLLEPVITIWVPLKLGALIVRTHPEMLGRVAEGWFAAAPMEMGRYADIILDIILAVLIFYFPGGYTHWLFFFMAVSHVWIYLFDHCRVLRTIPACTFASNDVDWWSQVMLIPCMGFILSCLVFKANRQGFGYTLEGMDITKACVAAFIGHCVVHFLLLRYVVPMFGKKPPEDSELDLLTYRDVAEKIAATWFSTNPVNCLRSQKIYHHEPPCGYFVSGKEHMLKVNPEIGCYFHDEAVGIASDPALPIGTWFAQLSKKGMGIIGKS